MDHGYSWVICFIVFWNYFFVVLGTSALGVLYPEFLHHFSSTNAETAMIGSFNSAIGSFSCLILAPLITRFGSRPISIAGSIIASLGYGICYFAQSLSLLLVGFGILSGLANSMLLYSGTIILHHYFDRRRALAAAAASCGVSVGALTMPPITSWLISAFGWRITMLILSAFILQSAICGALMRPPNHGNQNAVKKLVGPENAEKTSTGCCQSFIQSVQGLAKSIWIAMDFSLFLDPRFIIYLIGSSMFGYFIPLVYTPSYAIHHLDMSPTSSALLLSIMGGATLAGRVVSGILGDRVPLLNRPGKRLFQYAIPCCANGLSIAAVCLVRNEAGIYAFCIAFGFTMGGYLVSIQPVMVDLFGLENLPKIFTFHNIYNGILFLLVQPFAGWLVDISGGFVLSFVVCGLIQAFASLFTFLLLCMPQSKRTVTDHKKHHEEEEEEGEIYTIPATNGKAPISSEDDHKMSITELTTVRPAFLTDRETR